MERKAFCRILVFLATTTTTISSSPSSSSSSLYTCDFYNDACPYQINGVCNDNNKSASILANATTTTTTTTTNPLSCIGGDCVDCDPCEAYHYDCASCIDNGCHWCSGNAFCSSIPLPQTYFNRFGKGVLYTECPTEEDWTTTTCPLEQQQKLPQDDETNVFNDPLYNAQKWVYDILHVERVWNEYNLTGKGIHIRINDEGVDRDHLEFSGNNKFNVDASCTDAYLPLSAEKNHGTASASIAAGKANNHVCSTGIAPDATLSACNLFALQQNNENNEEPTSSLLPVREALETAIGSVDISSNSWGSQPCKTISHNHRQLRKLFLQSLQSIIQQKQEQKKRRRILQENKQQEQSWNTSDETTMAILAKQEHEEENDREYDDTTQECPFQNTNHDSPCLYCDFQTTIITNNTTTMRDVSSECMDSIGRYCSNYFKIDTLACREYLNTFTTCEYTIMTTQDEQALKKGIQQGRDGKGIIYVFAAGNDYSVGSDVNFDGWLQTRYTLSVGAVGKRGFHATYSTPGSALFVSAPGGDQEYLSNHMVAKNGGGCTNIGMGTSFATPTVAGVIALILQVNPQLTWRDVQGIVASTSRRINEEEETNTHHRKKYNQWTVNGANYHHSYLYGFGVLDAYQAVTVAKTWQNYHPEEKLSLKSDTINLPIPSSSEEQSHTTPTVTTTLILKDPNTTTTTTTNGTYFFTETVYLYLKVDHSSRGNLQIVVRSPMGTESILHPGKRTETSVSLTKWRLMTVRNWGENPIGTWTLSISDEDHHHPRKDHRESRNSSSSSTSMGEDHHPTMARASNRTSIALHDSTVVQSEEGEDTFSLPEDDTNEKNLLKWWQIVIYGHYTNRTGRPVAVYDDVSASSSSSVTRVSSSNTYKVTIDNHFTMNCEHSERSLLEEAYRMFITELILRLEYSIHDTVSPLDDYYKNKDNHHGDNNITVTVALENADDTIQLYDFQPCYNNHLLPNHDHCKNISARYDITIHINGINNNKNGDEDNHTDLLLLYEEYYSSVTQNAILDGTLEETILQMYPTSNLIRNNNILDAGREVETPKELSAAASNSSSSSLTNTIMEEFYKQSEIVIFCSMSGAVVLIGMCCLGLGCWIDKVFNKDPRIERNGGKSNHNPVRKVFV